MEKLDQHWMFLSKNFDLYQFHQQLEENGKIVIYSWKSSMYHNKSG